MDALFGDATTAMPTPASRAETGTLLGSPVPSIDLRGGPMGDLGPSSAIPGLDIDPPHVSIVNGKPQYAEDEETGEGVGGWISRMVNKAKDGASGSSVRSGRSGGTGKYKALDQDDE
jgi:hypothetical protein